ncbi:GNAT family N-acetyltransferase [Algivirga pacifica]|uniref:N-acetyltransferase domain-containing protein n=1 Tax=Algivirga pacifica TaxID=1162670 RepID=A0ABP9D9P0_9BACT
MEKEKPISSLNEGFLRKAYTTDASSISELILYTAQKQNFEDYTPEGHQIFLHAHQADSVKRLMEIGISYWVYLHKDMIIGVISVKQHAHIFHLYVHPLHQKLGIGSLLLEHIIQQSPHLSFSVNASKTAIPFYKKHGFSHSSPAQELNGFRYYPMIRPIKQTSFL